MLQPPRSFGWPRGLSSGNGKFQLSEVYDAQTMALGVLVGALASSLVRAQGNADNLVYVCVNDDSGVIRRVEKGSTWRANESLLVLNEAALGDDSVTGDNVANKSLTGADIQDGSITGDEILEGSLGSADLDPNQVRPG